MIYRFTLVLLLIGITSFTATIAQKHTIGFQGGIVSSRMSMEYERRADPGDKEPVFQRMTNLHFALSYEYNFLGKFYVNTGLGFVNKGSVMRLDTSYYDLFGGGTSRYQTNTIEVLTYLVVPVSLSRSIHLDKKGKHKLILAGGVCFNGLVKAVAEGYSLVEITPPGASRAETYRIEEISPTKMKGYAKWDFSAFVGGGYRFQLKHDLGFGIDYRFLSNFRNINETRFSYQNQDNTGNVYTYSPNMYNLNNHLLSIGIFMSPSLFLGLE